MSRCFVAVRPPVETRTSIVELQRSLVANAADALRLVPADQLHVTLRFWRDVDPAAVIHALARTELPSATARVGAELQWLGRDALVLPVAGLDGLAAAVRDATGGAGDERGRRFRGHLTIARLRRGRSVAPRSERLAASFPVSEIELVESRLGPGGATHERLAVWPVG